MPLEEREGVGGVGRVGKENIIMHSWFPWGGVVFGCVYTHSAKIMITDEIWDFYKSTPLITLSFNPITAPLGCQTHTLVYPL